MLPNCLVIGSAKCGTTSLYNYLLGHPQVFLTKKELGLFTGDPGAVKSLEEYTALFATADQPIRMDISPGYIYAPDAGRRLRELLGPETRIVAFLRNPVDAAASLWMHNTRLGFESLGFEAALAAEEQRKADPSFCTENAWPPNYHYFSRYAYAQQLKHYFEIFEPSRIRLFIFEEFFTDGLPQWAELLEFFGVDASYRPTNLGEVFNIGGSSVRSSALRDILNRPTPLKRMVLRMLPRLPMLALQRRLNDLNTRRADRFAVSETLRRQLQDRYSDDVRRLEQLMGRRLDQVWF